MRARENTRHEQERLEELRNAVHGVRAPFACDGSYIPKKLVTLRFRDKTEIQIARARNLFEQAEKLAPLVKRCEPSPFGMGRKTRYDRNVRDALQLKAENDAFSVLNFDPAAAGILEQIRSELTPQVSAPPIAELYALNIYAQGGHFVSHKDTPRGEDMLGTLVVCLPSRFSNGVFVLKHQGIFQGYEWGRSIEEQTEATRIHWAAFFGDVDHQIEKVWSGLRVTLTYLLRRPPHSETKPETVIEDQNTRIQQTLRTLLQDRRFLPRGGTLAFPCSHLYHQDRRFQRKQRPLSRQTVSVMKGRDYLLATAALAEKLPVSLCPYLIETCADETWQLDHFPTPREENALGDQLDPGDLEAALPIRASSETSSDFGVRWVDPPPQFNSWPTMYTGTDEGLAHPTDPDLPALAHLHACEYSATGYFGNEGADIDLYIYGALHIAIPPYGEGIRLASGKPRSRPRSPRGGREMKE